MNDEEDDYDKMKIREVKRRRKITTITTKTDNKDDYEHHYRIVHR